jgi:hypothetical protein
VQKGDVVRFEPVCPKAVWTDGKKPECGDVKRAAFFDIETNMPLRMQFSGMGISAWNQFQKEYRKHKNLVRLQGKNLADYVLKLTLDDKGTYFVLIFKFEEATTLNPAAYRGLMEWYVDNLFTRTDNQDDPGAAGSGGSADSTVEVDISGDADASVAGDINI